LERKRQEGLFATDSGTRQALEQAVAAAERYRGQQSSGEAEVSAAVARTASRLADLKRAQASLENSRVEVEVQRRQRAVLDSQELELRADVAVKRAALDLAQTNLNYTRIAAPEDGIVGERKVRAGQLVSPGTQVLSLVQQQPWVEANYKEDQLRNIREGDPAEIRVDAFPGTVVRGKVGKISPASGSQFALLPPDNATGNFTKIMQRVPVKIFLDNQQGLTDRLRPGLSVVVTVRTRTGV
jgi:membrane fusion protein (multidrug efflux system)